MTTIYQVWYHSVGCLPDGDEPEYVGTLRECERYTVLAQYLDYVNAMLSDEQTPITIEEWREAGCPEGPDREHDLYVYTIEPWYGADVDPFDDPMDRITPRPATLR
jgi:hypothetical protein